MPEILDLTVISRYRPAPDLHGLERALGVALRPAVEGGRGPHPQHDDADADHTLSHRETSPFLRHDTPKTCEGGGRVPKR
jgi:hypothetical protein